MQNGLGYITLDQIKLVNMEILTRYYDFKISAAGVEMSPSFATWSYQVSLYFRKLRCQVSTVWLQEIIQTMEGPGKLQMLSHVKPDPSYQQEDQADFHLG